MRKEEKEKRRLLRRIKDQKCRVIEGTGVNTVWHMRFTRDIINKWVFFFLTRSLSATMITCRLKVMFALWHYPNSTNPLRRPTALLAASLSMTPGHISDTWWTID